MFAGFLGERRGDVFQNGFTPEHQHGAHQRQRPALPHHPGQPVPERRRRSRRRGRRIADLPGTGLHVLQPEPEDPGHDALGSSASSISSSSSCCEANYIGNKTNHIESQPQHQRAAAPVSEHAADARRHLQQPTDREHSESALQPGARQHPGHLHRHHHVPPDPAVAVPGVRFEPSPPPRIPATPGITACSSAAPSASPRATPFRAATRSRNGCRPSTC